MAKVRRKLPLNERLQLGHAQVGDKPKLSRYAAKQPEVQMKMSLAQSREFDSRWMKLQKLVVQESSDILDAETA